MAIHTFGKYCMPNPPQHAARGGIHLLHAVRAVRSRWLESVIYLFVQSDGDGWGLDRVADAVV